MHCTWVYNNKFFIIKWSHAKHMTNFVSKIDKKNILRGVNFTNFKTPGDYIVKSKPQGVCLQLSQTLGGDYAIWPLFYKVMFSSLNFV
jgi:hypothetical protein